MSKVIGEIHLKRYDNNEIMLKPGTYPSLEQACFDFADIVAKPQIAKTAGVGEENFVARRTFASELIQLFADGLEASIEAALWKNPKKELPKSNYMPILFAIKGWNELCYDSEKYVKRGYYAPDVERFIETPTEHTTLKDDYEVDEVACWMPITYPIEFQDKEQDE